MLSDTLQIIKYYGLNLKKKYGQNFLIDKNIVDKIIDAIHIDDSDTIIEIGPGIGTLTQFLFRAKNIFAIEIDPQLVKILNDRFLNHNNLQILNADILKLDLNKLIGDSSSVKIVSNLPYYISTAVITKCLKLHNINSITVMVQKEVADRISAQPSSKSYGSLSIFSQFYADVSKITHVSHNCFVPKPNVDSTVVHFNIKQNYSPQHDSLFELVRKSFSQRRKTLINCLNGFHGLSKQNITDIFTLINLDKNVRGEDLNIQNFLQLNRAIKNFKPLPYQTP